MIHKNLVPHIIKFRLISERLSQIMVGTKPINTCIVNARVPTEVRDHKIKKLLL